MDRLVGREAELQALRDALARPAPVAIVLEGEAGIGKTALWRAGIGQAESDGMRVLVARPAEAETGLSHAALGDLLAPVIDELPRVYAKLGVRSRTELAATRQASDGRSRSPAPPRASRS